MLSLGRFPAAGTKSTNKKDPLQVLRLRTALPAEPTSFCILMPVVRLGLVLHLCVLPDFKHDDIFTISLFSNIYFLDLAWYSTQAQLFKGPFVCFLVTDMMMFSPWVYSAINTFLV